MRNKIPAVSATTLTPTPDKKSPQWTLLMSSILLVFCLSVIYLINPETVQFFNFTATDIILETAEPPQAEEEVVVVAIDELSLKQYGQWPWPRYRLARLLEKIKDSGATSIGVNILFPEQDRTSPKLWQETLENDFGYAVDTSDIPAEVLDYDVFLANTLADGPFVLGYEFVFGASSSKKNVCNLNPVSVTLSEEYGSKKPPLKFHRADEVVCNYEVLAGKISRSGFLNGTPDIDGVLRRLPLLIEYEGELYPSFALGVLMKFIRHDMLILQKESDFISRISLADLHIPTDEWGNFLLGPSRPGKAAHFSAADVLAGKISAESFYNKIVLVGLIASGVTQEYATPLAPITSLLDLHKYSIESLASGLHTMRNHYFPIWETVASFLFCLVLAIVIARVSTVWSVGLSFLAICSSWGVATTVYQSSGYLFSPLLPTVALILNCCLLLLLKFNNFQLQAQSETGDALLLLKSSENSLQSILKTIPDIVFRLDESGRINFISPAITNYMKTPEPLLGRSVFEIVAPEDLDKAQYRMNERRTGDRATFDLEIRLLLTKEIGKTQDAARIFSVSAEGIYQDNNPDGGSFLGTQGIVRDITDRKRLEHQLLQAQKMEVVGNLAAGIAHDLNNILSGLVSYPDLLLLEIPKDSPLHEKVSVIQRSGKKAAAIVQDLLTLARRSVEVNDVCNMNTIITDYMNSVEFQRVKGKYPQIAVHTDLHHVLMNVQGSAVHLSKVIMNVLHNALEAMPAGGEIVISTSNTYVDTYIDGYEDIPEGEYICTTVSDNGVGIPEKDLGRIFEPFYTKKSMEKSGTGLGMTVIWATMKDHKGYIDIISKEGQGTTLKMYLPSTREQVNTQQRRIVLDDYIGSEDILIVDDIAEQLEIAENMLAKLGYTVCKASSGEKALELIKRQRVDLVVLDMIMPGGLDGLETYREIIQLYPKQKAIITSGFSESERVKKLQNLGAGSYVQKPYTMEKLGMVVREELDRETNRAPVNKSRGSSEEDVS